MPIAANDGPDPHFGGCPHCGRSDGYVDFDDHHWFVCETHRVRWYGGTNVFSTCDNPKTQAEIAVDWRVRSWDVVKPVYPAEPEREPYDWCEPL